MNEIKLNLEKISNEIFNKNITFIAVSKTINIEKIKEALHFGVKILGENKVQEIEQKFDEINNFALLNKINFNWHLIGHLQTNKVKKAVKMCDMIQSVDSIKLLEKINESAKNLQKIQKVLIQINITGEISKTGVDKKNIFNFFDEIKINNEKFQNILVMGIMVIGPTIEKNKELIDKYFLEANKIFLKLKENYKFKIFNIKYLSMGMSHDYKIAIKNGSNMIRLGQNIFGKRIYK